jgi:hypothetical protein
MTCDEANHVVEEIWKQLHENRTTEPKDRDPEKDTTPHPRQQPLTHVSPSRSHDYHRGPATPGPGAEASTTQVPVTGRCFATTAAVADIHTIPPGSFKSLRQQQNHQTLYSHQVA